MTPLDYAVVVAYIVGVAAIGLFVSPKKRTTLGEYFLGNRAVPWLAATVSMIATGISCRSLIGLPGLAFKGDLTYLQMYLVLPIAAVISATVFLPFYSRLRVTSAYEYLGRRFSPRLQSYGSLLFQVEQAVVLGTIIAAPSLVMSEATGLSYKLSVCILLLTTLLYTSIGGMKAVIWTDVAQSIIFVAVPLGLIGYIILHSHGGLATLVESAAKAGKFKTFNLSWDLSAGVTLWSALASMIFWQVGNQCVNQVLIQRYLTTKSERDSRRTILVASVGILGIWILFLLLGSLLYAYSMQNPGMIPPETPTDHVFTAFVMASLPSGLKGAFIAAAFAAGMSSLSSILNSMGTVTLVDIWQLHFSDGADDRTWVRRARLVTIVWGVFSFGAALFVLRFGTVITAGIKLGSIVTGALLGMFLLGFFVKRANGVSTVIGSVVGMGSVILVMASSGISWSWYCGIGTLMTVISGYVASFFCPVPEEQPELSLNLLRRLG